MISIVMPTYKRAQYVKNAIQSIVIQTYKDWELLIIDDNIIDSQDRKDTENVVSSFNDSRIRYIQNEQNIGGALSRNKGIDNAKGEYLSFLDDDDMYLPTKLEVEYNEMVNNDWDFCVMDGATYCYETGEKLTERHQKIRLNLTKSELIKIHLKYHISGTNSFMYKTSVLREIGGFDDVPSCHEYFLVQKTLNADVKFGYIPQILIKNFMHEGEQISTGNKKLQGLHLMYEDKKKYFKYLTKTEQHHVTCRHYGTLFFVHFKRKEYIIALGYAIRCFFTSPKQAFIWMLEYKKKIVG